MKWVRNLVDKLVDYSLDWLEKILDGIKEFSVMALASCVIPFDVLKGVFHV